MTRRGFTLIEVMVVVVILGLLATVVAVNVAGKPDKAKVRLTTAALASLSANLDDFRLNHGRYPERLEDLVFMPAYVNPRHWPPGGYLLKAPRDAWDNEYLYRVPGSDGFPVDVVSYGADGKPGGIEFDEDLWNHARRGQ